MCWGSNTCPHAFGASTLLVETSPQHNPVFLFRSLCSHSCLELTIYNKLSVLCASVTGLVLVPNHGLLLVYVAEMKSLGRKVLELCACVLSLLTLDMLVIFSIMLGT